MYICFFNTENILDMYLYVPYLFYIYLCIQGHLDSFCTVAIVTSTAVNIGYSSPFDMLILLL